MGICYKYSVIFSYKSQFSGIGEVMDKSKVTFYIMVERREGSTDTTITIYQIGRASCRERV